MEVQIFGVRKSADTRAALVLREADYPVAYYIPREDADQSLLERTEHQTYCPYKGDASYYSVIPGGEKTVNPGDSFRVTGNNLPLSPAATSYTFYLLWSDGSSIQSSTWSTP